MGTQGFTLPPPSLELLRDPGCDGWRLPIQIARRMAGPLLRRLTSLKLYDRSSARLVTAENIAQAAQFVDSGNADAGLISLTSALTPRLAAQRNLLCHSAESLSSA